MTHIGPCTRSLSPAVFFLCLALGSLAAPARARADAASDLQAQIAAHNAQIAVLETQITQYQAQLDAATKQKSTLQSTVNALALAQKQLASQISVTQNKIAAATLTIQKLSLSIADKETTVADNRNAIASTLREAAQDEALPLLARLVSNDSFAQAWRTADALAQLDHALGEDIARLTAARDALAENRDAVSAQKTRLVGLKNDLATQKRSVDATKAAQVKLLAETKNKESNYQQLIAQKRASEQSFEQELIALQSQLNLIVHPGLLPRVGSGVLSWPFSLAFMQNCAVRTNIFSNRFCVTQYFGTTPFSTANPQVYNGHGHNGIDIAAPIGTPVVVALSGTVLDTGNTDLVRDASGRQCYSFGKWVLIEHGDGLDTLYAHLSEIDAAPGQRVATGQAIGLSGMTGYATGPHLHFSVYASEGTKVMSLRQFRGATIGCADARMPVATLDAYLNPLSYL